eukprot:COSAG01_NODE_47470_length_390_cov_0.398625_1_plen_68_part_01
MELHTSELVSEGAHVGDWRRVHWRLRHSHRLATLQDPSHEDSHAHALCLMLDGGVGLCPCAGTVGYIQ